MRRIYGMRHGRRAAEPAAGLQILGRILRQPAPYKDTFKERSLCFVWFSDYDQSYSMAYRFAGLPDSVDICSLWGGYPDPVKNPLATRRCGRCATRRAPGW